MTELDPSALFEQALTGSTESDTGENLTEQPELQAEYSADNLDSGAEEATTQQQQVDWEKRYKGLMRRYSQDQRRQQEMEQRNLVLEESLIRQIATEFPEETRQMQEHALRMTTDARRMFEMTMRERAINEEMDRLRVIDALAQENGVDPGILERFDDPNEMEVVAKMWGDLNKRVEREAQRTQRAQRGADRFEGTGTPPVREYPKDEDSAARLFKEAVLARGLF